MISEYAALISSQFTYFCADISVLHHYKQILVSINLSHSLSIPILSDDCAAI